jgi:hypothetical protein
LAGSRVVLCWLIGGRSAEGRPVWNKSCEAAYCGLTPFKASAVRRIPYRRTSARRLGGRAAVRAFGSLTGKSYLQAFAALFWFKRPCHSGRIGNFCAAIKTDRAIFSAKLRWGFLFLRIRLRARFRLKLPDLHCRMRLWRRAERPQESFVAAARDFFVGQWSIRCQNATHCGP